jgi:hypothetical protein
MSSLFVPFLLFKSVFGFFCIFVFSAISLFKIRSLWAWCAIQGRGKNRFEHQGRKEKHFEQKATEFTKVRRIRIRIGGSNPYVRVLGHGSSSPLLPFVTFCSNPFSTFSVSLCSPRSLCSKSIFVGLVCDSSGASQTPTGCPEAIQPSAPRPGESSARISSRSFVPWSCPKR